MFEGNIFTMKLEVPGVFFCFVLIFLVLLPDITKAFHVFSNGLMKIPRVKPNRCIDMVYQSEPDLKVLVQKSDMIIVVPTTAVLANQIGELRKMLPSTCEASVIPAAKLIPAVDGTAFSQLGEVNGVNFIVFVKKDSAAIYDTFTKWVRQVSKESEQSRASNENDTPQFFVCRKGFMLSIRKDDSKDE